MRLCRTLTARNRDEILRDVTAAGLGWRITIEKPRRTTAQNSLFWSLLQAFSDQVTHFGNKYDAATWKAVFMKALGKELAFVPSLDGQEIVALGYHSSDLSKEEMSDMVELIYSEGSRRGVRFHDEKAA
jgi:NinB protein